MIDRFLVGRLAPDDFLEFMRTLTSVDTSLLREVLLEIEALRARLDERPTGGLAAAHREFGAEDVAAGRAALLLAGFAPEELTGGVVREIIEYAPALVSLGRRAVDPPRL